MVKPLHEYLEDMRYNCESYGIEVASVESLKQESEYICWAFSIV